MHGLIITATRHGTKAHGFYECIVVDTHHESEDAMRLLLGPAIIGRYIPHHVTDGWLITAGKDVLSLDTLEGVQALAVELHLPYRITTVIDQERGE